MSVPAPASVRHASLPPLGLHLIERGWLSANQVLGLPADGGPATVVDTGFCAHAAQTVALLGQALAGRPLGRILNTHLHSDHCGGNAALQALWPGLQTWVPQASLAAVQQWQVSALSHELTGQPCPRFRAEAGLSAGASVDLGNARWQVWAAPGHDMGALMLFEPQTRTLISGDALWEDRLAIIFPELDEQPGFEATRQTLALIERLAPRLVLPGHGPAFEDVGAALAASRQRLDAFSRQPERHLQHAARALVMFHLLEHRTAATDTLVTWMLATPVYRQLARRLGLGPADAAAWASRIVASLVDAGSLDAVPSADGRPGVQVPVSAR